MTDLTAIILTKNEEIHIEQCIKSISGFAKRIIVVDSGSTDKTIEIAQNLGAEVFFHPFENYSHQFNWAIDYTNIRTKWTLRIDADERFTPELVDRLEKECLVHENDDINGFVLEAWLFFLGKKLSHGGKRKRKLMVFKSGFGRIEDKNMDEHTILLSGKAKSLEVKFIHDNRKNLHSYVEKLNWYAEREVQDYFEDKNVTIKTADDKIRRKRDRKKKYYKAPMFWRCVAYFFYAYILKGTFLNGKEGFIYSFLYHFYYRLLVDAKIYEQMKSSKEKFTNE